MKPIAVRWLENQILNGHIDEREFEIIKKIAFKDFKDRGAMDQLTKIITVADVTNRNKNLVQDLLKDSYKVAKSNNIIIV